MKDVAHNGSIALCIAHVSNVHQKVSPVQLFQQSVGGVYGRVIELFSVATINFPAAHICNRITQSRDEEREGERGNGPPKAMTLMVVFAPW